MGGPNAYKMQGRGGRGGGGGFRGRGGDRGGGRGTECTDN